MLSPEELMRGLKPLEAMENKTQPLRCESHLAQADEAAAKLQSIVRGNKVRRRKKTEEELIFTKEELAPAPAAGRRATDALKHLQTSLQMDTETLAHRVAALEDVIHVKRLSPMR